MTGSEPTLREAARKVADLLDDAQLHWGSYPDLDAAHEELLAVLAALPPAASETDPVCSCGPWKIGRPQGHLPGCPRAAAAPETWTCPTCHTPMPADAAVGHLRGEIDVETLLLEALPDVLSWATEQDDTYGYSDEPGSPYVKLLASGLARRLRADAAASGSGGETTT